ncbi:MAG TPA: NEW3 domain-containing protein [Hyphomicrobiaceae bacterium]|nr:NEW3 domain-containing protein [Hyphomicrobiaceae bacterium]
MRAFLFAGIITALLSIPTSAKADSPPPPFKGLWLTAEYPSVTLRAGEEARLGLTLINYNLPPQRAELAVLDVPGEWEVELKGGGRPVSAAYADYGAKVRLDLVVNVPRDIKPGSYKLRVTATAPEHRLELPIGINIEAKEAAKLTAEAKLPVLRGTPKSSFDFRVNVKNEGAEDVLATLVANAPRGFQVAFKEAYGTQELTSIPIKAGESKDLQVEIRPPASASAGQYPVAVKIGAGNTGVETKLTLDITGQPTVTLTGENDRLSGEASAGTEKRFPFILRNTGTAPARNIELSAYGPSGWKVSFEPKEVAVLEPKAEQRVEAVVVPSEKAVAGDYVFTARASGDAVSESATFRVTVVTSTLWGVIGIGIIAASLVVLAGAVGRFGRR